MTRPSAICKKPVVSIPRIQNCRNFWKPSARKNGAESWSKDTCARPTALANAAISEAPRPSSPKRSKSIGDDSRVRAAHVALARLIEEAARQAKARQVAGERPQGDRRPTLHRCHGSARRGRTRRSFESRTDHVCRPRPSQGASRNNGAESWNSCKMRFRSPPLSKNLPAPRSWSTRLWSACPPSPC